MKRFFVALKFSFTNLRKFEYLSLSSIVEQSFSVGMEIVDSMPMAGSAAGGGGRGGLAIGGCWGGRDMESGGSGGALFPSSLSGFGLLLSFISVPTRKGHCGLLEFQPFRRVTVSPDYSFSFG
jgi:hypothetical protein